MDSNIIFEISLFAALVLAVCMYVINRRRASPRNSNESESHLYKMSALQEYRFQQLEKKSNEMEKKREELNAVTLVENLSLEESVKLQLAVDAAKRGATSAQLSDKYELLDVEAELIVSLHGDRNAMQSKTIH